MTQIDEPDKLQELFENYHIVKYDNIDGYTRLGDSETDWYELYTSIKALIANQVTEARIDELERLELRLCKSTQYGIPVVDLQSAIDDRIKELGE